jgi:hypothetical protein
MYWKQIQIVASLTMTLAKAKAKARTPLYYRHHSYDGHNIVIV